MALQFDLVSPERNMASGEASMVSAPGVEGDFAVLPGHAPFVAVLRPGVLSAVIGGETARFVVFGGMVEAGPDRCTVLADDVAGVDEVTDEALDTRIATAEAALASAEGDDAPRAAQLLSDLKSLKMYGVA